MEHASDCALHNGPAYERGKCDCGAEIDGTLVGGAVKEVKAAASVAADVGETVVSSVLGFNPFKL